MCSPQGKICKFLLSVVGTFLCWAAYFIRLADWVEDFCTVVGIVAIISSLACGFGVVALSTENHRQSIEITDKCIARTTHGVIYSYKKGDKIITAIDTSYETGQKDLDSLKLYKVYHKNVYGMNIYTKYILSEKNELPQK